jgi:hypothetical protein
VVGKALASELHQTGKAHSWSSCLLYRASIHYAEDEGIEDPQAYAFNGTPSLAIHYLLGLGLELMLKSAIAAWDPAVDAGYLRDAIGHDLVKALDEAEARGFASQAPHLRELVELLRKPYRQHWFRYERPDQIPLPGDFDQVVETLATFESDLADKLAIAEDDGG